MIMHDWIMAIIVDETGKTVTPETSIESLGLDSLEFLNLIHAIESECGVRIDDSSLPVEGKISDILAAVLA